MVTLMANVLIGAAKISFGGLGVTTLPITTKTGLILA